MPSSQRQITDEVPDAGEHQPTRPGWLCEADGADWPCEPYREYVLATCKTSVDRAVHMAAYWTVAVVELPTPDEPGDIHRRFLGWTRAPAAPSAVLGRPPGGLF